MVSTGEPGTALRTVTVGPPGIGQVTSPGASARVVVGSTPYAGSANSGTGSLGEVVVEGNVVTGAATVVAGAVEVVMVPPAPQPAIAATASTPTLSAVAFT
ncbi:hypothetical protein A5755_19210 [Mycolicibacterium fortuitum]|nr:hypothetical protein G155_07310 [Mycobacterium sp. VKM Ac-1817D]AMD54232.1 hypothetical protein ATO49_06910 [Mycolicibacterium fortuitum subsp. fortuitum DSM 46621 = ATCC 6841 = JCM 6387]OBB36282.1 hypothetical protein A5763_06185 [Mycolicibacterium fortuitum]BDD97396.1 hypothetical protein MFTT_14900 [Mycolicibacterium fortuitum subsp. fortuitum]EJZ14390.1 hypothetical protein MFORT_10000 [Mycolicibacterium fortuitum subsp. fortuitum DSM 46621 = ATCC 6841 = JCM 6387]